MEEERAYLKAVESGSLKGAGEQLGLDPSVVSRRIASLEERLGAQLLHRSTRGSRPTDAGQRYYEGLRQIVDNLDALEANVAGRGEVPHGILRVTAPLEFGARFVVPVLDEVAQSAPELEVDIQLGSGFVDLDAAGIDVAIRIGTLRDSALRARRLGSVPRVLVTSPDYLKAHGLPKSHQDLANHAFIGYRRSGPVFRTSFKLEGRSVDVELPIPFTVNSMAAIVELVRQGRGLHFGPLWAFDEFIQSGELVRILPDYELPSYPLHAVYTPRTFVPAKIRVFIDAMVEHIGKHETLR